MSHFTVLVVGEDVEGQLAPFHEFECTGHDDQYVVEVDKTDEAKEIYEKDTENRVKSPSGKLSQKFTKQGNYKRRFLREPTAEETKEIGPIAGRGGNGKISWTSNDWKDGRGYRVLGKDGNELQDMLYFIDKYQKSLDKQLQMTIAGAPWSKIEREILRGEMVYLRIHALQDAFMRKQGISVVVPAEIVQAVLTFSEKAV